VVVEQHFGNILDFGVPQKHLLGDVMWKLAAKLV
jgi:hypothetical protein